MSIIFAESSKEAGVLEKAIPTRQNVEAALSVVAPRYDIAKVYLFGSVARGVATKDSDVDLCLETGSTFSLFNAGAFAMQLQDILCAPVDVVSESCVYPHVREGMMKDRVLAYER